MRESIGDTRVPTVVAFSNDDSLAILIPAMVKRECVQRLRQRGKTGTVLYMQLFAVSLYLLLKEHARDFSQVTIDIEYPGHEVKIEEQLLNQLRREKAAVTGVKLDFLHIGKKSRAHEKALAVFNGDSRPNRTIGYREISARF
ncbi:MAG: hypothetical protein ABIL11_06095 [Chloroflexota bacterium]